MTAHTPGPWFIRYCDDDYHQCMTVISSKNYGPSNTGLYDDEPDTIAIVYHQLSPYVGTDHHPDEHDSNVRLISAAPDLLEALEAVNQHLCYRISDTIDALKDISNAAIAKAKGEV